MEMKSYKTLAVTRCKIRHCAADRYKPKQNIKKFYLSILGSILNECGKCSIFIPWAFLSETWLWYIEWISWILISSLLWKSGREAPACETDEPSSWQGIVCLLGAVSHLLAPCTYSLQVFLVLFANLFQHIISYQLQKRGGCILLGLNLCLAFPQAVTPQWKLPPCFGFCVEIHLRLLMFPCRTTNRCSLGSYVAAQTLNFSRRHCIG